MLEDRNEITPLQEGTPRWLVLAVVVLAGVSLVALGVAWSASNHSRSVQQAAASDAKATQQTIDSLNQRLAKSEETSAQSLSELNAVTDRLKSTQGEVAVARRQTKQISAATKQLSEAQSSLKNELATKASTDDVTKLGGDVAGVRTDLDATKNNLQMARGELGTLIARNHDEIDQLRRLGERDYFEFTLTKKSNRQKVGSMMVELRSANQKRNQFTVALYVDDMRLEKKNRSVNEPIYFYTRGSRRPLELVVNQVGKDRITGYLSVPKSAGQPSAASGM